MLRRFTAVLLLALAACSPAMDWREMRDETSGLRMAFPCKPDRAEHQTDFAGAPRVMLAQGCEAGRVIFAVVQVDLGAPGEAPSALEGWSRATLANIHAGAPQQAHFVPAGALDLPASMRVTAAGQGPDGSTLHSEAAYFARGSRVFQAVIYAPQIRPEVADSFFTALSFQ